MVVSLKVNNIENINRKRLGILKVTVFSSKTDQNRVCYLVRVVAYTVNCAFKAETPI